MNLKVAQVIGFATKFLREYAGFAYLRVMEVKADEENSQWIVIIDVGLFKVLKKEITIDDSDGNVIGYK